MRGFLSYAFKVLHNDWQVFGYTFQEELYPFFQRKRSRGSVDAKAAQVPVYQQKRFIYDLIESIFFLPVLFIALLCWNIGRALPFWSKKSELFPDKIFDLANGVARHDYLTVGSNRYAFLEKLYFWLYETNLPEKYKDPNVSVNNAIREIIDNADVDCFYSKYQFEIHSAMQGFIGDKTRIPASFLLTRLFRVMQFLRLIADEDEGRLRMRIEEKLEDHEDGLSFGDHVWLYFFRHLYRSYFPWEQSALLPHGKVPSFFAQDKYCLLYSSPSPRDLSTCRMPSSA